jgi:hypothetical protein
LTVTNNTDNADGFSARVFYGVRSGGLTGPSPKTSKRVDLTWDISKNSGNANSGTGVNLGFEWPQWVEFRSDHNSGKGFDKATMNYFNNSINEWEIATTGNSQYTSGGQSLLHEAYKGTFSLFGVGGSDVIPLPVTFGYFEAIAYQQKPRVSQLKWQTLQEINNSHFEIEWSDGSNPWEQIGKVNAIGNTYDHQDYSFFHLNPTIFNQYRIKQVDWDGGTSYSDTRVLWWSDLQENITHTRLYPNPARDAFSLELIGGDIADFTLYDPLGKLLESGTFSHIRTFKGLPAGVYLIKVQIGTKIDTKKVVVSP